MRTILLLLALTMPAHAESFGGWIDDRHGDVLNAISGQGKQIDIKLADISVENEAAVDDLILHRVVLTVLRGTDADGSVLGTVFFGGKNVNEYLVLQGMARATGKDAMMMELQAVAQAAGKGIWAGR